MDKNADGVDEAGAGEEKATLGVGDDPMVAEPTELAAAVDELTLGGNDAATPPEQGSGGSSPSSSDSEDGMPVSDLRRRQAAKVLANREATQTAPRTGRVARRAAIQQFDADAAGRDSPVHRRSPGATSKTRASRAVPGPPPAPAAPVPAGGMTGGFPGLFSLFGGDVGTAVPASAPAMELT